MRAHPNTRGIVLFMDFSPCPKVRFAVSCTSAYADLYDRMEQALRERVANAVEVVRSDISPALLVYTGPNLVGVAVQGL